MKAMKAMKATAIRRDCLSRDTIARMLRIMRAHFDGVNEQVFLRDLEEKNWVVLIEDSADRLVGFSTLLVYRTEYHGQRLCVAYSGDSIVERSAWASFSMPRAWIRAVKQICAPATDERLIWLLISSGYRTYRFLPVFLKRFYPCYDRATPPEVKAMIDTLARQRFGAYFDPQSGIVRFPEPQSLRHEMARVPDGKAADPHVAFFLKANPGYRHGDELVCFADLGDANLNAAGKRLLYARCETQQRLCVLQPEPA